MTIPHWLAVAIASLLFIALYESFETKYLYTIRLAEPLLYLWAMANVLIGCYFLWNM